MPRAVGAARGVSGRLPAPTAPDAGRSGAGERERARGGVVGGGGTAAKVIAAAAAAATADVSAIATAAPVATAAIVTAAAAAATVSAVRTQAGRRLVVLTLGPMAAREAAFHTPAPFAVATRLSAVDRPAAALPPARTHFAGSVWFTAAAAVAAA